MDSKEFGLVAAQQLFQLEDIHYGFWKEGETPNFFDVKQAQKNYSEFLTQHIEKLIDNKQEQKILDIGCGIGTILELLLQKGYRIDGVIPSPWMAKLANQKAQSFQNKKLSNGKIYPCVFEDFPYNQIDEQYSLAFFSESFQYVKMDDTFECLNQILKPNSYVIIFDFFAKDNVEGKSPLGGGHSISEFLDTVKKFNYQIQIDQDVTKNISPTMEFVNQILMNRVVPFFGTLDAYLSTRHKFIYRAIKWLLRKRVKKLSLKYKTPRDAAAFEKYKTYRLFVLKKT